MTYNEARKRARNRLRKYSVIDVSIGVIEIINSPTKDKIEQLQKLPWIQLQLLRICFEDQLNQTGKWSFNRPTKLQNIVRDLEHSAHELWSRRRSRTLKAFNQLLIGENL
jgi:hypothetical protein